MTTYQMTTINSGTRIRNQPNTAGTILTSVNAAVTVTGTELFTALVPLSNSLGVYQFVGDKWLKVSYNGIIGWMAYIHKGEIICGNFKTIEDIPPVVTPPAPVFPDSFVLENPKTGERAEYVFVRVLA